MKNHYLTLVFTHLFLFSFSQIPDGYYNNATANGYELKTQLYNIINQQNDQGYNAIDTFFSTYDLDSYYENNYTILDIYSENPQGTDPYNYVPEIDECGNYSLEGDCYNKEHLIPKSVFNENSPMQGDAHHLVPVDGRVNGFRGNFPMGRVDNNNLVSQSGISNPTMNGSKLGVNLNSGYSAGYGGIVFEPIDEFKGDIARIHFYFATRYQNIIPNWSDYAMFNGSSDQVFNSTFLSILLEWHEIDPVSQKEIDRNNAIYYEHQGNRNPFIDHPEFVYLIWNLQEDNEAPTTPTNLIAYSSSSSTIELSWSASNDNVAVVSYDVYMNTNFLENVSLTSMSVQNLLPETNYCFSVIAKDLSNNTSIPSDAVCEITLTSDNNDIDLFFSEYVEGSGNNKALEIANFTGNSLNLDNYSLKLSSNGNNNWTVNYNFPNNLIIPNNSVFVVANGGTNICAGVFDDLNNNITSFNGNDALGLFKDNVLIDIIGTLGDDSEFAQNITLRRSSTITSGTSVFDLNEWNNFALNDCDNLGYHTQSLNIFEQQLNFFKVYPNPTNGTSFSIESNSSGNFKIFNITGKKIYSDSLNSGTKQIDVSKIESGMYFINFKSNKFSQTKKILIR
tara:strand:+ start:17569 stop:19425 length:1857 start_codon:yes stop_codon:yes gene_type:complete